MFSPTARADEEKADGEAREDEGGKVKKKAILTVLAILFCVAIVALIAAAVIGLVALIVLGLSLCIGFAFSWKIVIGATLVLAGAYILVQTTRG